MSEGFEPRFSTEDQAKEWGENSSQHHRFPGVERERLAQILIIEERFANPYLSLQVNIAVVIPILITNIKN